MWRRAASGFTLTEVVIMGAALTALGTFGTVGLPVYRDYTTRNRVGELVAAAARCKADVAHFYALNRRLPESAAEAGCPDRVTRNANPLAVFNGEVIVQAVGGLATELGSRNLFAFRAVCTGGECAGGPIREWTCSSSGDDASSTTILPKYLPSSCR